MMKITQDQYIELVGQMVNAMLQHSSSPVTYYDSYAQSELIRQAMENVKTGIMNAGHTLIDDEERPYDEGLV